MGLFNWLRKRGKDEPKELDPLHDLSLSQLRLGYLVDYDLKTWEVTAYYRYDFGDGYESEEWELRSATETVYLEREEDDEVEWSILRKIPIGAIDGDIRKHILEHDDPPSRLVLDGVLYHLDGSGGGHLRRDGTDDPEGFLYWDFIDRDEKRRLTLEQWSETELEAATGHYVEEYEMSNILPREKVEGG